MLGPIVAADGWSDAPTLRNLDGLSARPTPRRLRLLAACSAFACTRHGDHLQRPWDAQRR
jgi:hypothetical protein